LELFPIGITSDGTIPNGIQDWYLGLDYNTTLSLNSFARKYFRVSIMWTSNTGTVPDVSAAQIVTADYLRLGFWMCYMTTATMDFTDDILKQTVTFKCLPFDRAAAPRITIEESATTLKAMSTFDAGVKPTNPSVW